VITYTINVTRWKRSSTPVRESYQVHYFRVEGIETRAKAHMLALELEGLFGDDNVTMSEVYPSTSKEVNHHHIEFVMT